MNRKSLIFTLLLLAGMYISSCKKDNPDPSKPAAPKAAEVKTEILTSLKAIDSISSFAAKFNELALTDDDVAEGLTIFATVNKAFSDKTTAVINPGTGMSMSAGPAAIMAAASNLPDNSDVKDYIVKGKLESAELTDGKKITALSGKQLNVSVKNGSLFLNNVLVSGKDLGAGKNFHLFTISAFINNDTQLKITSLSDSKTFPGWLLTIHGANFSTVPTENIVKINSKQVLVNLASTDSLVVTVPPDATGGNVSVSLQDKTVTSHETLTVMQAHVTTINPWSDLHCQNIQGIAIDANDNIYFTDPSNYRVFGFNPYKSSGPGYSVYQPLLQATVDLNADGRIDAQDKTYAFFQNWAIATDAAGAVYVASLSGTEGENGGAIYKMTVSPTGEMTNLELWAGGKPKGLAVEGPKATISQLTPTVMAFDYSGNFIFNQNILSNDLMLEKISGAGQVSRFLNQSDYKSADPNINKDLITYGLAPEKNGSLYVSDLANARIWKYSPEGLSIIAGNGVRTAKDGVGSTAQFGSPFGIVLDSKGNLYVCDNDYDHGIYLIRVLNPMGVVTTIAGGSNQNGAGKDGIGTNATFAGVNAITIDSKDILYIASDDGSIRQLKIQ